MNDEIEAVFAQNKNNILAALRTAGVKKCTINYSGCGDSGQCDELDFGAGVVVEDVKVEQTDVTTEYDFSGGGFPSYREIQKVNEPKLVGLREAIENLCYSKLEKIHDGWEIDAGAQGSFVIDVERGTIKWHHETNIMEVEVNEEEF
jgi:hypothetical protein